MTSARGFAPIGWFDGNKTAQLVSYPFEGVSPPPSAAPPSNAGATSFSEFGMWIRFAAPYRTGSVLSIVVGRGRFLVSCSFSLSKSQSYNLFICLVSGRRLPRDRPRSFANLIGLPLRGVRQRGLPLQLVVRRPGVSPPPSAAPPSKRWRDLILRVWHVDPLRCPVCNNHMRVIAVIDDPAVVRKIFRHLGLWHDPPPVRASPGQHECLLEPWLEDPMPDYENVLTD
jgi:hypothetical protein